MITYHRHAKEWLTLQESVAKMQEFGVEWHKQGPFQYCDICKCVPTSYIGKVEEKDA